MSEIYNPYLPYPVRIDQIVTETEDQKLKTFKLVFLNPEDEKKFNYIPGQFAELSVPGKGEIPIGIASSPTEKGFLSFTVNEVGVVTTHLHMMKEGYVMGVRGPMGNWYPWEEMEGKNVIIIGGGFAFTTLRSSIVYMLHPENRPKFKDIIVVYGARSPGLLLYKDELAEWERRDDIKMHITVDATTDPNWKYNVGFVPSDHEAEDYQCGECDCDCVRSADHDQVYAAGAGGAGVSSGENHPVPGDADEVRDRDVRPVQHRGQVCVQRRPGVFSGATEATSAGILAGC